MAQNQESIWGTINTTLEIAINVYYLIGDKGSGLKVPAGYGDNPKLQQYLAMGDRDGDYLYFPESAKGYGEIKDALCEEYSEQTPPSLEEGGIKEHEAYSSYAGDTLANWTPEDGIALEDESLLDGEDICEDEQDGFEP